ncbi:MAG: AraC family transcriptional regulator [Spirochaetes bacterium]|nr:AraC family transcriptional regulator [Spirochaetota bacterium]
MIFVDIFNCITIFQLFMLAAVLFLSGKNKRGSRYLAFFLIIQSFGIIDALIGRYYMWSVDHLTLFFFIPHMITKIWGMALLFYVLSMITPSFKLRPIYLLHTIPMLAYGVVMYVIYYQYPMNIKKEMLMKYSVYPYKLVVVLILITLVMNISYIVYILHRLNKYSMQLREYYSSIENKNLKWLQFVVFSFSLLWFSAVIQYGSFILSGRTWETINLTNPMLFLITCYIVIRGWLSPEVFINTPQITSTQKHKLSEDQKISYKKQLEEIMQKEKLYLEPELSITALAKKASIPERHLSKVLNESYGQNFYDYINSYRVKESIKYLLDHSEKRNILQILLDAGFNSKTAFNVAFKKNTGMNPSEFKRKNLTPDYLNS